jgi:hypothetical protein
MWVCHRRHQVERAAGTEAGGPVAGGGGDAHGGAAAVAQREGRTQAAVESWPSLQEGWRYTPLSACLFCYQYTNDLVPFIYLLTNIDLEPLWINNSNSLSDDTHVTN